MKRPVQALLRYTVQQLSDSGIEKAAQGEPLTPTDIETFANADTMLQAVKLCRKVPLNRRFDPCIIDNYPNERTNWGFDLRL